MTGNDSDGIGGPCDSCASIAPALVVVEAQFHPDEKQAYLCHTCYNELAADSPVLPVLDDIIASAKPVTDDDEEYGMDGEEYEISGEEYGMGGEEYEISSEEYAIDDEEDATDSEEYTMDDETEATDSEETERDDSTDGSE